MTDIMQAGTVEDQAEHIAPAPRVSVQAFCETVETAAAVQAAGETGACPRRISRSRWRHHRRGRGLQQRTDPERHHHESVGRGDDSQRSRSLAEVCDAGTRVVVIGRHNDVLLYRELTRRGVSDYLIAPVGTLDVVRSICGLFSAPDAKPVGRVAVTGAKRAASGPPPSPTTSLSRWRTTSNSIPSSPTSTSASGPPVSTTIRILDVQDRRRGVLARPHRHRLHRPFAVEVHDHLSLLAAPATARAGLRFRGGGFRPRSSIRCAPPCPASCSTFRTNGPAGASTPIADDILIVAAPDLANLRHQEHARLLRTTRSQRLPAVLLPQHGRRSQAPGDQARRFRQGARRPVAVIPFEPPVFGTAANNGQMIAELSSSHRTAETFRQLAQMLIGRADTKKSKSGLFTFIIDMLMKRSA